MTCVDDIRRNVCVCMTSAVTCQAQQLVSGVLTTPHDVTFNDVIEDQCPDGLMDSGLSFDKVKCTVHGRRGLLSRPQSDCQLSKSVHFCRAMLCISAAYATMRCPSVRLRVCMSVTFVNSVETNKHYLQRFHHQVATPL